MIILKLCTLCTIENWKCAIENWKCAIENWKLKLCRPLVGVKKGQTITIVAEELISNKEVISSIFSAWQIPAKQGGLISPCFFCQVAIAKWNPGNLTSIKVWNSQFLIEAWWQIKIVAKMKFNNKLLCLNRTESDQKPTKDLLISWLENHLPISWKTQNGKILFSSDI